RLEVWPDAQVRIHRVWVHYFAGIHAPFRIPSGLEFPKSLHNLTSVHDRKKLRARLTIAVFTGQRAAETRHHVRRLGHKLAIIPHAFSSLQIERDASMQATVADM